MNKRTSLFLLSLTTACLLKAQHDVTYDFQTLNAAKRFQHFDGSAMRDSSVTTVRAGDVCTFTIVNVNTFIYDVSINGESVSMHSEPPEAFKLFFHASSLSVESTPADSHRVNQKLKSDEKGDAYAKALGKFQQQLERLEAWKSHYDIVLNICQSDGTSDSTIIKDVTEYMSPYLKPDIIMAGTDDYDGTMTALSNAITAYSKLPDAEKQDVAESKETLIELQVKLQAFDYPAFFTRFNILYKQATNANTYRVVSAPVVAEHDLINFKIKIVPRNDLKYAQPLHEYTFDYPVRVRSNIKVDFSTGVFFSFDEARGRTYRLDPIPGDTQNVMIVQNTPSSATLPSLGAAIHASWRTGPAFACGGMLGLGLNSKSIINPNFYVGLSGIFGWRERFILSFGYALNHVDYLGRNYRVEQVISKNAVSEDQLTEKTYRGGLYLAFTFNLTNQKKNQ